MNVILPEKEADWWRKTGNNKILCALCPRYCTIAPGQSGYCFVRKNVGGKLWASSFGRPTGFAVDPIEKKPLNHFYPGSTVLSFGTSGCNLGCKFCQNWTQSRSGFNETEDYFVTPEEVVKLAEKNKTPSIAFTYNEPTIFGEYVVEISKLARQRGIKNVMVTNGYIDKEARKDVYKYVDAANVDLKAFTDRFYFKLTASHLNDVLDTLIWLKNETDIWIELTTLLIPGENDSANEVKEMCNWVLNNLGDSIPLHFTAFHPDFKMTNRISTTPTSVKLARQIALSEGIKYCYTGNIQDKAGQITYCPECNASLIERDWHSVISHNIADGKCCKCGFEIAGRF